GRVPSYPPSVAGGLSCVGPIARNVRDAATVLTLAAGPDARDPTALPPDGRDYLAGIDDGVKGWKIAWTPDMGYAARVHEEIVEAVRQAVMRFASLGASVTQAHPGIGDPIDSYLVLLRAGYRYSLRNLDEEKK